MLHRIHADYYELNTSSAKVFKKLGNFQNITSAVKLFIECDYINGTEINIDGGMKK